MSIAETNWIDPMEIPSLSMRVSCPLIFHWPKHKEQYRRGGWVEQYTKRWYPEWKIWRRNNRPIITEFPVFCVWTLCEMKLTKMTWRKNSNRVDTSIISLHVCTVQRRCIWHILNFPPNRKPHHYSSSIVKRHSCHNNSLPRTSAWYVSPRKYENMCGPNGSHNVERPFTILV